MYSRWNSAVFATIPISTYGVAMVTQDFISDEQPWTYAMPPLEWLRSNLSDADRLNRSDCIDRYIAKAAGSKDVIIVIQNLTMADLQSYSLDPASSLISNYTNTRQPTDWNKAYAWMCSAWGSLGRASNTWCTWEFLSPHATNWTLTTYDYYDRQNTRFLWAKVDFCISGGPPQSMNEKCALRFSPAIMVTVCILNFIKFICICYTAWLHYVGKKPQEFNDTASHPRNKGISFWTQKLSWWKTSTTPLQNTYLVTIGDAIASFLENEDKTTADLWLPARKDFEKSWPDADANEFHQMSRPVRWFHGATPRRWKVTISL